FTFCTFHLFCSIVLLYVLLCHEISGVEIGPSLRLPNLLHRYFVSITQNLDYRLEVGQSLGGTNLETNLVVDW
ncbi:Uncharacterized protein APZ42_001986, partial [Daphnia magna]